MQPHSIREGHILRCAFWLSSSQLTLVRQVTDFCTGGSRKICEMHNSAKLILHLLGFKDASQDWEMVLVTARRSSWSLEWSCWIQRHFLLKETCLLIQFFPPAGDVDEPILSRDLVSWCILLDTASDEQSGEKCEEKMEIRWMSELHKIRWPPVIKGNWAEVMSVKSETHGWGEYDYCYGSTNVVPSEDFPMLNLMTGIWGRMLTPLLREGNRLWMFWQLENDARIETHFSPLSVSAGFSQRCKLKKFSVTGSQLH